jgi:hypothetical protein
MQKTLTLETEDFDLINFVMARDIRRTKTLMKENEATEDGRKANETLKESLQRRIEVQDEIARQVL